jgi:hypothetical protein
VCVAVDDVGDDRVVNVAIGEEAEDIRLARDAEGQPLVNDEHMELLDPGDPQHSERHARPSTASGPTRHLGRRPDALRSAGLYDPVEPEEDDEDEDLEPLEL